MTAVDTSSKKLQLNSDVQDLVTRNSTKVVNVTKVVVEGGEETRDDFLRNQIEPLFIGSRSLGEQLQAVDEVTERLRNLDMYRDIQCQLDVDPSLDITSQTLDLTAKFSLSQPNFHRTSVSSYTAGSDPLFSFTKAYNNLFFGGESVQLDLFTSSPVSNNIRGGRVTVESPIFNSSTLRAGISGLWTSDILGHSSHSSRGIQGTTAYLCRYFGNWRHELGFETANLSINSFNDSASDTVRVDAGETLRSLIYANSVFNSLDTEEYFPKSGVKIENNIKLAGPAGFGDVQYTTLQSSTSYWRTLDPLSRLTFNGKLDTAWLISGSKDTISDRLYLRSLYGFENNGIGPKDCQDAVGGRAAISAAASIYGRFPRLPAASPLRWKVGFNGGSLVDSSDPQALQNGFSTGYGVGIAYKNPVAFAEVMYVAPLSHQPSDQIKRGLQFQLGLQYF